MQSQIRLLTDSEAYAVSGGSFSPFAFLKMAHIIMGAIELTNYVGERWNNGCQVIDENDYFAKGLCTVYRKIVG